MADRFDQPVSLALLRQALTSEHYPRLFKGEGTHDAARNLIAQLVAHTQDEDLLHAIVASGLPADYNGNTLREIASMVKGAVRKGFDKRAPRNLNNTPAIQRRSTEGGQCGDGNDR
jgi:hypothetical protein